MEPFVAGPQIHQGEEQGWGKIVAVVGVGGLEGGGVVEWSELCGQTSGNAPISSDVMRAEMDGSYALFGN